LPLGLKWLSDSWHRLRYTGAWHVYGLSSNHQTQIRLESLKELYLLKHTRKKGWGTGSCMNEVLKLRSNSASPLARLSTYLKHLQVTTGQGKG
jgi:cytochrome c553